MALLYFCRIHYKKLAYRKQIGAKAAVRNCIEQVLQ